MLLQEAAGRSAGRPDRRTGGQRAPAADDLDRRPTSPRRGWYSRPTVASVLPDPPEDTIVVSSPLYRYAFSTRGGRMIEATLFRYHSMRPEEKGRPAQILPSGSDLLTLGLLSGRDTVWLRDWRFTPRRPTLDVQGPTPLDPPTGGAGWRYR